MRHVLNQAESIVIWTAFFATTVYGHVALKWATGTSNRYEYRKAFEVLGSFWGWTAVLAWTASALIWVLVLTRHSVLAANSISALRYILICGAAWLMLGESLRLRELFGITFVAVGILLLVKRV